MGRINLGGILFCLLLIGWLIAVLWASKRGRKNIRLGLFAGAIVGYPLSYFLQPGVIRMAWSIADYFEQFSEVVTRQNTGPTALGVWLVAMVAGAAIGHFLGGAKSKSNE
jgi:hypothetical protein